MRLNRVGDSGAASFAALMPKNVPLSMLDLIFLLLLKLNHHFVDFGFDLLKCIQLRRSRKQS